MSYEFRRCLDKGKLVKFSSGPKLVSKELKAAQSDLKEAEETLSRGSPKWATIQAYYAMFHTARALIYSQGYREKSHYCLMKALEKFFVEEKLLPRRFLRDFSEAMDLRESADYKSEFSKKGASRVIKNAKALLDSANILLGIES